MTQQLDVGRMPKFCLGQVFFFLISGLAVKCFFFRWAVFIFSMVVKGNYEPEDAMGFIKVNAVRSEGKHKRCSILIGVSSNKTKVSLKLPAAFWIP